MPPKYLVTVRDDLGILFEDMLIDQECCWGYRSGERGELCGGCVGCLIMQAEHAGHRITYDYLDEDEEAPPPEPSIWKFDLLADMKLDG